jgi:hypothetical protein
MLCALFPHIAGCRVNPFYGFRARHFTKILVSSLTPDLTLSHHEESDPIAVFVYFLHCPQKSPPKTPVWTGSDISKRLKIDPLYDGSVLFLEEMHLG